MMFRITQYDRDGIPYEVVINPERVSQYGWLGACKAVICRDSDYGKEEMYVNQGENGQLSYRFHGIEAHIIYKLLCDAIPQVGQPGEEKAG